MMHDEEKYLRPEEVSKILQVTTRTLENWSNQGILNCVRTKGNHRISHVRCCLHHTYKQTNKRNICYCRVSSSSQKEDLERQVEFFRCKYPNYEIIKDIGSGLNFKRKGITRCFWRDS